jgi:cyclopropane-fatty-acyl-phospholipid synthase
VVEADGRTAAGARLVRLALGGIDVPLAVRLWDGHTVALGDEPPRFTLVFRSRRVFRRLLARPSALAFGEAYIDAEIDLEGDVFEAMRATHRLEGMRRPLGTRLAMLREWLRA